MIDDMRHALNEDDAIAYVQNHAHPCAVKYGVRHPQPHSGGRAVIGEDPRDLVVKLCALYKIDRRLKAGPSTKPAEKESNL